MGYSNNLKKFIYGAADLAVNLAERSAKKVDRMSDAEIEKKFSKPAEEVRMDADMVHFQAEMYQMKKKKRKKSNKDEDFD